MVEIIYDDRMSLRHSAIRHFIVNKGAVIFPGHLLGFFFQRLEIAAVVLVIDFIIKRHKVRTFFCDIIHNRLLKTASQVQVLQPEQVALALHPLKNRLEIRDARKNRRNKTDGANACIINLLHSRKPSFDAYSTVHIIFEILIERIDRPRYRDQTQLLQQINVTHHKVGFGADQNICAAASKLLQQFSGSQGDVNVPSLTPEQSDPGQGANSNGTEQTIQADPVKPDAPEKPESPSGTATLSDDHKAEDVPTSERKTEDEPHPTYPEQPTSKPAESQPAVGSTNSSGQVYVPGFGYVDSSGDNTVIDGQDIYENGNKIGEMGGGN